MKTRSPNINFLPADASLFFVLSGPSGGGKTTLIREWRKRARDLGYVANVTTRAPRPTSLIDETGIYEHVTKRTFRKMVEDGAFAQWACSTKEKYKGTPIAPLRQAIADKKDLVFDLTPQEYMNIKRNFRERTVGIFVIPPSMQELRDRLISRRTEAGYDLDMKLAMGLEDMGYADEHDYFLVNDRLDHALHLLTSIRSTEHQRLSRHPEFSHQCKDVASPSMMFYYDPEGLRIEGITSDL